MKYVNANTILPAKLLTMIQKYYQGGYLYIPKEDDNVERPKTTYKIELEKRNQYIYLKHLEGRTNIQLGAIYHLSESSVRRIIAKERVRYQNMKEMIEQILPLWEIKGEQISQIYPSSWEIDHSYVLKVYDNKDQLERNLQMFTKTGEKYAAHRDTYFFLSKKLPGNNVSDPRDKTMAWKMGCAIAQLHNAFLKIEKEITFWDNSLLQEMKGWILENLVNSKWQLISETEYSEAVTQLGQVYDALPRQLIHRDVHFGNFLFLDGDFSGYIDFDLSQKNIRIFDICYFLTGLLAEETSNPLTQQEWLGIAKAVISGYESITQLSETEKGAIPCVMECIEILFVAYFTGIEDTKHANDAYNVFHFIQNCFSHFPMSHL